jgi:hypothetical protein
MLLLLKNLDTFHEYRPGGIYTIGEIVSHMVLEKSSGQLLGLIVMSH